MSRNAAPGGGRIDVVPYNPLILSIAAVALFATGCLANWCRRGGLRGWIRWSLRAD